MDTWLQESEFVEGFTKSSLMILVSEIGDKTFFIAAVMAMRHPQLTARAAMRWRGTMRGHALTRPPAGACGRAGGAVGHDGAVGGHGVGGSRSGASQWRARCGALGLRFAFAPCTRA